jgi:cob(I)alamin adenosyltransferase
LETKTQIESLWDMKDSKTKGLIHVYTGNGKGKTTAALGTALRAAGHGLKVLIIQFMKRQANAGEIKALEATELPITIRQFGRRVFFKSRTCEAMDIHRAHQGLQYFKEAMESDAFDIIILDEINMALYFGLVEQDEVIDLIQSRPSHLHLLLTGRKATRKLKHLADLVTEMKEVKHYYRKGVQAQKGLEY